MDLLKLIALDAGDLDIVSAHVQDAVATVGNLEYWKPRQLFVVPLYRFVWEKGARSRSVSRTGERRNGVLDISRVRAVRTMDIPRDKPAEVLSLLAIRFEPLDAPAGTITLVFSGGGRILLDVECIEARLADLGGAWEASSRPAHAV